GAELVLDDLVAECDEKLDRVRQQNEIAKEHSDDEEADDRQPHEPDEPPLLWEERRVDVCVDLVQDDGHSQRETGEERNPEVGREVLSRAEGDQRCWRLVAWIGGNERAVHRGEEEPHEVGAVRERKAGRDDERDRQERESGPQLTEVLNERELFVALASRRPGGHLASRMLAVA